MLGVRAGLTLHDAWRTSPRSILLFWRSRREAALDQLELMTHSAVSGAVFQRVSTLDASVVRERMPKRKWQKSGDEIEDLDAAIRRHNERLAVRQERLAAMEKSA